MNVRISVVEKELVDGRNGNGFIVESEKQAHLWSRKGIHQATEFQPGDLLQLRKCPFIIQVGNANRRSTFGGILFIWAILWLDWNIVNEVLDIFGKILPIDIQEIPPSLARSACSDSKPHAQTHRRKTANPFFA